MVGVSASNDWMPSMTPSPPQAGLELHPPSVFPAATDSRWIRLVLGTPCFGFSPIRRTPILLHDHDEHVPVDIFLEGVRAFEALIPGLADAPPEA